MSVPAAYLGVVLIWATTPLTIQWSGEGGGPLFGVAARMVLGTTLCLALLALLHRPLPRHPAALKTYLAAGLGLWGAMTSVYWGAQHIPSGLISVLFGFTTLVTALMAAWWLGERALTPPRLLGMGLGLAGLGLIFQHQLSLDTWAGWGMGAVLLAVHLHSASAVWVKRLGAGLSALETTTGSLLVALPLFLGNWAVQDGHWPQALPPRTLGAILYLAVFGSTLGFILYYHVLHRVQASRVALITLVTPVLALLLGQAVNGERVGSRVWLGTAVILAGLACFQWGGRYRRKGEAPG